MRLLSIIVCCIVATLSGVHSTGETDCVDGPSRWYVGTINVTITGKTCQRWDVEKPHKPKHLPHDGSHHNYCRNPDLDLRGTWCYTTDNNTRWEYCNISKCPDDSLVIWTSYNSSTESTYLFNVHADPEVVRQITDSKGSFQVNIETGSNRSMTEYWALAAHYHKNLLYFSDYRSEYLATWNMKTKQETKYFEGMAHGVECLAFDWRTNNLYWTDSEFKWVMVSDDTFTHYAPIYRTAPNPPYGLAIHSVQRFLVFSTYKALGSKIIKTDLAGKNAIVLWKFPSVFDVTGLAIDYTDDRLYWTDFTGYGGMVVSSTLDGQNRTQHNYRGGSIFWGVAPYLEYLYVSDVHARYSISGDRHYSVWILTKETKRVYRYTLAGKPRGVAIYSHNEEYSDEKSASLGECDADHGCDHICLPRINATRECVCSLGYHLDKTSNKCLPQLVNDNYLLVADAGQGKVFQIPITNSNDPNNATKYSIVPLGAKWKAETVAVDQSKKFLYWSDKKESSVSRSSVDGTSRYVQVATTYANSMIIDPHTGHLFYSDNERDSIRLSKGDGGSAKTIVKPDTSTNDTSSIRMIVQDIKYKYIYWTDTYSKDGLGKVMRCRYDGTEKEVVLDKLNWPHAITIDYKTNRMYVAEAKDALIYELDLSSLTTINSTSTNQKTIKQYDVSAYISRVSPYIIDLKIHQDMAYVVDGKSSRLERFNLSQGAVSMTPFGPAEFFRVTTLSVYSETFYTNYIKPVNNPCFNHRCRQMCVALSDTKSTCLCEDGMTVSGFECTDDPNAPNDTTPPVPRGCPSNTEITLPTCSASVTFSWTAPTWRDETTGPGDILVTEPALSSPAKLTAGRHTITYSAQDVAGNRGYCSFIVNVRDNQCTAVPTPREGMQRTNPTCGNREGSYFNVTCKDPNHVIWVDSASPGENRQHNSYVVVCSKNLNWEALPWLYNSKCKPPPTTIAPSASTSTATKRLSSTTFPTSTTVGKATTTTSTTTTTSATTASTTTASTTTTTPKPTTTTSSTTITTIATTTTSATKGRITSSVKPSSTTRNSPITSSPTPATSTTTRQPNPRTTTGKKMAKSTTTTSSLTKTTLPAKTTVSNGSAAIRLNNTANDLGQQSAVAGLSTGVTAAIAVLVVVLVIVIVVVIVIAVRRSSPTFLRYSFPQFWKSAEDTIDLQTSDGNRYNIM